MTNERDQPLFATPFCNHFSNHFLLTMAPEPAAPPNPNLDATTLTYDVRWIRDVPGYTETMDSVSLWAVKRNGEKMRIRTMSIAHVRRMRESNRIPASVTDSDFIGQGVTSILAQLGFDHVEMSVKEVVSPRREGAQVVEFPADAFEQGTTSGTINPGSSTR